MKTPQELIDLLEAVSLIDKEDVISMFNKYGFDAVEHEIKRASSNLQNLHIVEIYDILLNPHLQD